MDEIEPESLVKRFIIFSIFLFKAFPRFFLSSIVALEEYVRTVLWEPIAVWKIR